MDALGGLSHILLDGLRRSFDRCISENDVSAAYPLLKLADDILERLHKVLVDIRAGLVQDDGADDTHNVKRGHTPRGRQHQTLREQEPAVDIVYLFFEASKERLTALINSLSLGPSSEHKNLSAEFPGSSPAQETDSCIKTESFGWLPETENNDSSTEFPGLTEAQGDSGCKTEPTDLEPVQENSACLMETDGLAPVEDIISSLNKYLGLGMLQESNDCPTDYEGSEVTSEMNDCPAQPPSSDFVKEVSDSPIESVGLEPASTRNSCQIKAIVIAETVQENGHREEPPRLKPASTKNGCQVKSVVIAETVQDNGHGEEPPRLKPASTKNGCQVTSVVIAETVKENGHREEPPRLKPASTKNGCQSSKGGRPRYDICDDQIKNQYKVQESWSETARLMGVSRATLYRRRKDLGMTVGPGRGYSDISDEKLDALLTEIRRASPMTGERSFIGALRGRGLRIQRDRLRKSLRRISATGEISMCRPFSAVPRTDRKMGNADLEETHNRGWPNDSWFLSSNQKLSRWGFIILGCVDGYSRVITFLSCSTNNKTATITKHFCDAVNLYGVPGRVHSDGWVADRGVTRFMASRSEASSADGGTATSIKGLRLRIRYFWQQVDKHVNSSFARKFHTLEDEGLLDPKDERDLYSLHLAHQDAINKALGEFVGQHNNHPMKVVRNKSPLQLWHSGMIRRFGKSYRNVHKEIIAETTGDDSGENDSSDERAEMENDTTASEINLNLSEEQVSQLRDATKSYPRDAYKEKYVDTRKVLLAMLQG